MTPAQAERWLGIPESAKGRNLLRVALRREAETGKQFLLREGGDCRKRYLFTPELIRRHLPELWEGRFQRTSRRIAQTLASIESKIDAKVDERIANHPKILEIEHNQNEALELLEQLAAHVESSVGKDQIGPNRTTDINRG